MSAKTITTPGLDDLFAAAYKQHAPMVEQTISARLSRRDPDLAADLTQVVFLTLYSRRERRDMTRDLGGLLRTMARAAVADHYRVMRNTREVPADMGHWAFANRNLCPAGSGACEVVNTGFRTARIGGQS